jgi:SAM-dependent methyltransferase
MPPKPPDPPEIPELVRILSHRVPGFAYSLMWAKGTFAWNSMPPETYAGKDVLDIGCGVGAASAHFLERGARSVWGIDPVLPEELIQQLSILPRTRFLSGALSRDLFGDQRFDLVYAHFVTEHIHDLPIDLALLHDLLRPGGRFVGIHDNYYGPMGGHDHAFMGPTAENDKLIECKAVRCWESAEKCETSAEFRAEAEKRHDWTATHWDLTPEDCSRCQYFHRARIWGHLLSQDSYALDYPGDFYRSNVAEGGLNKVTPFQLRQYLIEAGFQIKTWEPHKIQNQPPPELLERFSRSDLQTSVILFAADKPANEIRKDNQADGLPQSHKSLFSRALKQS